MKSNILREAILDAKDIKNAAESAAKEKLLEALTPQLKSFVKEKLMEAEDEEEEKEKKKEEEEEVKEEGMFGEAEDEEEEKPEEEIEIELAEPEEEPEEEDEPKEEGWMYEAEGELEEEEPEEEEVEENKKYSVSPRELRTAVREAIKEIESPTVGKMTGELAEFGEEVFDPEAGNLVDLEEDEPWNDVEPPAKGKNAVIEIPEGVKRKFRAQKALLEKYKKVLRSAKRALDEEKILTYKLSLAAKALNSSLNHKQRNSLIEALDQAGTIKEARIIFNAFVKSFRQKKGKINESRNRGSSSAAVGRVLTGKKDKLIEDKDVERLQRLAGIKKKFD